MGLVKPKSPPASNTGTAQVLHRDNTASISPDSVRINERTAVVGLIIPVVITVYQDRTYSFITKTSAAVLTRRRAAWKALPVDPTLKGWQDNKGAD